MRKIKDIEKGFLTDCRQIPSPHFDERPDLQDISLLVIHYISLPPEQFGGGYVDDFFQGKLDPKIHPYFEEIHQMRVSAHCLIEMGESRNTLISTIGLGMLDYLAFKGEKNVMILPLELSWRVVMNNLLLMSSIWHCKN